MPKLPDERAADNPWPEYPRVSKTDYGQEEAAEIFGTDPRIYQTTVKEFVVDDKGELKEVVLVKLEAVRDKKTGRLQMKEIKGSEYTMKAELGLIAAGFVGAQSYITKAFGVKTTDRGCAASEQGSHRTNAEKVYVCGDMHIGQSLVVRAIREGRDCAREVDEELVGYTNL